MSCHCTIFLHVIHSSGASDRGLSSDCIVFPGDVKRYDNRDVANYQAVCNHLIQKDISSDKKNRPVDLLSPDSYRLLPVMEISKKHIAMFVALGIAVVVFLADRVMPGGSPAGPGQAHAAEADVLSDETTPEASSPADDRETQAAEVRTALARRLDSVARSHRLKPSAVKDAFFPSTEWVGPRGGKVVVDEEPKVNSAEVKAQEFARMHQLKGAIVASDRSIAIIDGNCVSVGQMVDGFELKSVTADTAVLVCEGTEVVLKLNAASPKKVN